jgi:hypothetical protein
MTVSIGVAVSIFTIAIGVFVATSPNRAANILACGRLEALPPEGRALYLRFYRTFGIILCLGGALMCFDSMGFW